MRTLRMELIFLALFLGTHSFAKASEIYPFFRGVRAEGMGGAAVATTNDETALFLNPAGLGKIRGPYFILANPEIETNYDTQSAFGANLSSYTSIQDPQALLGVAQKNPDKNLHARVQVLPAFVTTNFGFGLYGKYNLDAEYSAAQSQMQLNYVNDYGAVIGYTFRLLEGRLKIGVSGKVINRVYVNRTIPGNSTNLTFASLASEGAGAGWDAGVILTAPWMFLPTLAVVAHDVGNTYFNLSNGYFYKPGPLPPPQYQSVDAALAIFPIHSNSTRSSFTVEWRDAQNPESQDVYRRIHAGMEINFSDILYLRAGMNQRYYTAGLELDLGHQQIQFATYGEEIGTPTINREDRRFTAEWSFRF